MEAVTLVGQKLAELTKTLCSIPSETGEEKQIADWVEGRCRLSAPPASVHRIGNSVVCDPASEMSGVPTVALVGHLDTVRCAEQQPLEIRDGRVYGCGASDMKAGVATMLALLEQREALISARPLWIFYDKEEGAHAENGLEPVLQSGILPAIDLAIVLEPTDMSLQMGCMGTMHATVTVAGQRAHSARPWQGDNAIFRMIPLLQRFEKLQRREVAFGELIYYEVSVPTQISTANSKNVVPDRVEVNVNVRFAPGNTVADAEHELRELVGDLGEVKVFDRAPAGEVYLDHPLIEPWRLREQIPVQTKQAWTDVARFTERGIAAVNFGPGETAQAHQSGEWCSVQSLEFAHARLRAFFAS
ncbi:succinyl-diaminopimelate desuccinylase [soil metagenome]